MRYWPDLGTLLRGAERELRLRPPLLVLLEDAGPPGAPAGDKSLVLGDAPAPRSPASTGLVDEEATAATFKLGLFRIFMAPQ